jgi:hypothetical protein
MEAHVAKGQMRSNREIRKPKKSKSASPAIASVSSVFAKSPKTDIKAKKR